MATRLELEMLDQPNDTTCGPTCLHAVYRFHGDELPLAQVIEECRSLDGGGTLDVFLANHALRRGYRATIHTFNLHLFDPTWFEGPGVDLAGRLAAQAAARTHQKVEVATEGYLEYLRLGGRLDMTDLSASLVRGYLKRDLPILTGLSATYLYRTAREDPVTCEADDVSGKPAGHFVVLSGYDRKKRTILVSDPYRRHALTEGHNTYEVSIDRLRTAILLGIATYDANLLVLEPPP